MAITAATVLQEARELHPAFAEKWTPDPLAWRFLGRYQRTLVSKIAVLHPDLLEETDTISLPLTPFASGHTLPDAHLYRRGISYFSSGLKDVFHLIPWQNRPYNRLFPGGSILKGVLYLLGQATDWTAYASIDIKYVPIPALITAGTDTFVLPDYAHPTLVAATADYLAARVASVKDAPSVDVRRIHDDKEKAQSECLRMVATQRMSNENMAEERW